MTAGRSQVTLFCLAIGRNPTDLPLSTVVLDQPFGAPARAPCCLPPRRDMPAHSAGAVFNNQSISIGTMMYNAINSGDSFRLYNQPTVRARGAARRCEVPPTRRSARAG
jgi:hypothetical protein